MDLTGLPFFTGVAIYCYEGAGMILALEASIAKDYRSRFKFRLKILYTKNKQKVYIQLGIPLYIRFVRRKCCSEFYILYQI